MDKWNFNSYFHVRSLSAQMSIQNVLTKYVFLFSMVLIIVCIEGIHPSYAQFQMEEKYGRNLLSERVYQVSIGDAVQWAKTYGGPDDDKAAAVLQAQDGGFTIVGETHSFGAGSADIWVLKLNKNGAIEWQKTFGGPQFDTGWSIQQTTDEGFIVAGLTYSFGAGSADIWVLKLNKNGVIEWQKTFGGSAFDGAHSIQQTTNGGYIVAGYTQSFQKSILILKLDRYGAIEWQKTYGSSHSEWPLSVLQTSDGNYIISSHSNSFSLNGYYTNIWILKIDSNGDIIWDKVYNPLDYGTERVRPFLKQTLDNGYIAAGYTGGELWSYSGSWIFTLTEDGEMKWHKYYNHLVTGTEKILSLGATSDGGYIFSGLTSDPHTSDYNIDDDDFDVWFSKIDKDGNVIWNKTFGGSLFDRADSILQISDGNFIVAGTTSSFGAGEEDILLLKLDKHGSITDCPHFDEADLSASDNNKIVNETDPSMDLDDITSLSPAASSATIQNTDAAIKTICSYIMPVTLDFHQKEYDTAFHICLEWSDGIGVGTPRPCPPRGNPYHNYSFSEKGALKQIPQYLVNIYNDIIPVVTRKDSRISTTNIIRLFEKAPTGVYYSKKLKEDVLGKIKKSQRSTDQLSALFAEAVNAIELDLSVPKFSVLKVDTREISAVDFQGVAWMTFRHVIRPGNVSLKINRQLPSSVLGFKTAWPIASYEMEFTGTLDKNGYIDISFYIGGIRFVNQTSDIHIFEWDGKTFKDITTGLDLFRGVITGRTDKLKTYVIMSRLPKNK
jgi:hypothetical protein